MKHGFKYGKLGGFTYHVLQNSKVIEEYLMEWIMRGWEKDHNKAPDEHGRF